MMVNQINHVKNRKIFLFRLKGFQVSKHALKKSKIVYQLIESIFRLERVFYFAFMASYFFCLPQKSNQKEGTQPSRPDGSLALLNKISRSRNSP